MLLVLRIQQPERLPLYLRHLHRDGSIAVTFDQAKARRFPHPLPAALDQVRQVAAAWPQPGDVAYINAPA